MRPGVAELSNDHIVAPSESDTRPITQTRPHIFHDSLLSPTNASPNETAPAFVLYIEEQITMFETSVLAKRTTLLWGAIMGVVALAVLLGAGYVLII